MPHHHDLDSPVRQTRKHLGPVCLEIPLFHALTHQPHRIICVLALLLALYLLQP